MEENMLTKKLKTEDVDSDASIDDPSSDYDDSNNRQGILPRRGQGAEKKQVIIAKRSTQLPKQEIKKNPTTENNNHIMNNSQNNNNNNNNNSQNNNNNNPQNAQHPTTSPSDIVVHRKMRTVTINTDSGTTKLVTNPTRTTPASNPSLQATTASHQQKAAKSQTTPSPPTVSPQQSSQTVKSVAKVGLEQTPLPTINSHHSPKQTKVKTPSPENSPEIEDPEGEIRCVCGKNVDKGLMIQCEKCLVWQHSECLGIAPGADIPASFKCEICEPRDIRCICQGTKTRIGKIVHCSSCRKYQHARCMAHEGKKYIKSKAYVCSFCSKPNQKPAIQTVEPTPDPADPFHFIQSETLKSLLTHDFKDCKTQKNAEFLNSIFEKYLSIFSDTDWETIEMKERLHLADLTRSLQILSQSDNATHTMGQIHDTIERLQLDPTADKWRFYFYTSFLQNDDHSGQHSKLNTLEKNIQEIQIDPHTEMHPTLAEGLTNKDNIAHFLEAQPVPDLVLKAFPDRTVGLATSKPIAENTFIIEFKGHVRKIDELMQSEPDINQDRAFLLWLADINLCVDSRTSGNLSRYIRRSCSPNVSVRPLILDGSLRVAVYSNCQIPADTELTFDFDYPWRQYGFKIQCACEKKECQLEGFYKTRSNNFSRLRQHLETEKQHSAPQQQTTAPRSVSPVQDSKDKIKEESKSEPKRRKKRTPRAPEIATISSPQTTERLSREDRKMEALLRQFERMEKTEPSKTRQNESSGPTSPQTPQSVVVAQKSPQESRRKPGPKSKQQKGRKDDELSPPDSFVDTGQKAANSQRPPAMPSQRARATSQVTLQQQDSPLQDILSPTSDEQANSAPLTDFSAPSPSLASKAKFGKKAFLKEFQENQAQKEKASKESPTDLKRETAPTKTSTDTPSNNETEKREQPSVHSFPLKKKMLAKQVYEAPALSSQQSAPNEAPESTKSELGSPSSSSNSTANGRGSYNYPSSSGRSEFHRESGSYISYRNNSANSRGSSFNNKDRRGGFSPLSDSRSSRGFSPEARRGFSPDSNRDHGSGHHWEERGNARRDSGSSHRHSGWRPNHRDSSDHFFTHSVGSANNNNNNPNGSNTASNSSSLAPSESTNQLGHDTKDNWEASPNPRLEERKKNRASKWDIVDRDGPSSYPPPRNSSFDAPRNSLSHTSNNSPNSSNSSSRYPYNSGGSRGHRNWRENNGHRPAYRDDRRKPDSYPRRDSRGGWSSYQSHENEQ